MIDLQKLKSLNACKGGIDYFRAKHKEKMTVQEAIQYCIADNELDNGNWLITKILTKEQNIKYAIFAAEQVLDIFENEYPDDNRPRMAIQSAKNYLLNPSCIAVSDAVDAAYTTAVASAYADASAYAAANAASAAAYTAAVAYADASAYAAYGSAVSAVSAVSVADTAAAKKKLMHKILNYGLTLLLNN